LYIRGGHFSTLIFLKRGHYCTLNNNIIDDLKMISTSEIPDDWEWYGEPFLLRLEDHGRFRFVFKTLYPQELKR